MRNKKHKFEMRDLVRLRPGENLMSGWRGIGYVVRVSESSNPDFDIVNFIKLGCDDIEPAGALAYQLTGAKFESVRRMYG